MDTADFYWSCKARVIGDFGGGENGDDEDFNEYGNSEAARTELLNCIRWFKRSGSTKILFAVTTSNQPYTEELLESFGFVKSNPSSTTGGREITGWVLSVDHFDESKVK